MNWNNPKTKFWDLFAMHSLACLLAVIVNVTLLFPEKIHRVHNYFDGRTIFHYTTQWREFQNQDKSEESRKNCFELYRRPIQFYFRITIAINNNALTSVTIPMHWFKYLIDSGFLSHNLFYLNSSFWRHCQDKNMDIFLRFLKDLFPPRIRPLF